MALLSCRAIRPDPEHSYCSGSSILYASKEASRVNKYGGSASDGKRKETNRRP